jgi:hypothetical protein
LSACCGLLSCCSGLQWGSDRIEQLGADRLAALVQLSKVRQVSLPVLMETLGIQSPTYV